MVQATPGAGSVRSSTVVSSTPRGSAASAKADTALSIAAAVTIAVAPVAGPDSDHVPVCTGDQIPGIDGCVEGRPGAVGCRRGLSGRMGDGPAFEYRLKP